jgi:ABC-type uncharacterized transport system ATPase subunit
MQYATNPHVPKDQAQPGDLIFFYSPISHVGMYIGDGMTFLVRKVSAVTHIITTIAGMNAQEAKEIAQVILKLKQLEITIVLVEHNMEFVMSVCDELSVLNFGRLIAHGTPKEIQNDATVIEAYLGTGVKK